MKPSLIILSDYPSPSSNLIGKPYSGSSGYVFDALLHHAKLLRSDIYCDYLNPNTVRNPNDLNELLARLDSIDCSSALLFGPAEKGEAKSDFLKALTGVDSIENYRGSILPCTLPSGRLLKIIPTYHPSKIMAQWDLKVISEIDIDKAVAQSKFPDLRRPERNLIIRPTFEQVFRYCENLRSNAERIMFDIETASIGMTCISLAMDKVNSMSIPTTVSYWGSTSKLNLILKEVRRTLQHPGSRKCAQNASFDIQYLARFYNILPSKPWDDTMLMQHACYSELPKGLDFLASMYTDEPYYKSELKEWRDNESDMDRLWTYNARDAAVQFEVMEALEKEMDELGVRHTYNYSIDLLEPLIFMMLRGMKFDRDRLSHYQSHYATKLDDVAKSISDEMGGINIDSPKQILDYCSKAGIKLPTKQGKPTTEEKALSKVAGKYPVLGRLLDAREQRKLLSTYLEMSKTGNGLPLTDAIDGRFRCSFNSVGTTTGRLSSNRSIFYCGNNAQNWPRHIRDLIVAEEGKTLVCVDLKGAEAMEVAYLSNDPFLIKKFEDGENVHNYTCELIWGINAEIVEADKKVKKHEGREQDSYYQIGKKVRHGGNYLQSWKSLSEQLRIPAAESRAMLQRFYDGSPGLQAWHESIKQELKRTRKLTTPLGRTRIFFGRFGDDLWREAVAFIPQSTVAHIINLGIIKIYNELCCNGSGIEVNLQVHDEVVFQVPDSELEATLKLLPDLMKVPQTIHGRTFSIPIEIAIGKNWRDKEEVKL